MQLNNNFLIVSCCAVIFLLAQMVIVDADTARRSENSILASRDSSVVVLLNELSPTGQVDGLSLRLPDPKAGPLSVRVHCVSEAGTPRLAIDAKAHGPGAKLSNVTSGGERQCYSYRVSLESGSVADVPAAVTSSTPSERGLTVGVHHSGIRPSDVLNPPSVFVFNPVHGNWAEAVPYAPSAAEPQTVYAILSERSQQIIGGAIALPENLQSEPTRSSLASLTRPLEQVSPLSGYLDISGVEPDSKGAYDVKLPLLLRPSRGPGPSFSVRYSSSGAPGVLGRGWDLSISSIDVRGPSPVYHPAFETEDYMLDGVDLIALDEEGKDIPPLYKGGPIIPRVADIRIFRPRNNSIGQIVRRYGNDPGSYFWEVWDPSSHVTRLFGGAFNGNDKQPVGDGDNGVLKGEVTFGDGQPRIVIGQWALTAEYDAQPARTGAVYRYVHAHVPSAERCRSNWSGACTPALRLHDVSYNRSLALASGEDRGVTLVRFAWSPRDENRYNSDGRLGLFRASEYWLDEIIVEYQPALNNLWLTSAAGPQPPAQPMALFSRHRFIAHPQGSAQLKCQNFDRTLQRYEVEANDRYDGGKPVGPLPIPLQLEAEIELKTQVFEFEYAGEDGCIAANDYRVSWPIPSDISQFGKLPYMAPTGQLGFSTKLLDDLGFGLLSKRSLLGTGRNEETGASLYVGIGPPGDTSNKVYTGGVKVGTNFTKSEGNSTLVDITGDGIDDIVYKLDGKLQYCAGSRKSDSVRGVYSIYYPEQRCGSIIGVSEFSAASSDTNSVAIEGYPNYNIFGGVAFNRSNNETYVYFSDSDGDSLVDIVNYGRILYNQGEVLESGQYVVRFVPRSGLIPPVPGAISETALTARLPSDMRDFIRSIEAKLEETSRAIMALDYSQKVIAWEAPLPGRVNISGELMRGVSKPETDNEGPLGRNFGPSEFEALPSRLEPYSRYIRERRDCAIWAADQTCHGSSSDPLGAHFASASRKIEFARTYPGHLKIWLSRRSQSSAVECGSVPFTGTIDLNAVDISACKRAGDPDKQIHVEAGDVLYIGYSVHPHLAAWVRPNAKIAYEAVDNDAAFNLSKAKDPRVAMLPCGWKELTTVGAPTGSCLLGGQARYEFDLSTGFLTSSAGATIILPAGRDRAISGQFEIPADITKDYRVLFEVQGEMLPLLSGGVPPPLSHMLPPSATLKTIFQQDVSSVCASSTNVCTINIAPSCVGGVQAQLCDDFRTKEAPFVLKSRIRILHRIAGQDIEVRNISERLAALRWLAPPIVTSELTQPKGQQPSTDRILFKSEIASQTTVMALPITMGDPDIEYARVKDGRFKNPDTTLDDGDPRPDVMSFSEITKAEWKDVELAKLRQTLALCSFASEIHKFFQKRMSEDNSPHSDYYGDPWAAKISVYTAAGARCPSAEETFKRYSFTTKAPEITAPDSLGLPFLLKHLALSEQLTSAETLLERVLANLALGEELLIDSPMLTRRGYRLPAKANPFDCDVLSSKEPISAPIAVQHRQCAFRLSTNFAMQQFEEVVSAGKAKNIRDMLEAFQLSNESAFKIELRINVNGNPVRFRELTGDQTGNAPCSASSTSTCIGSYGTREPIAEHFHPPRLSANPDTQVGDVLQRITLNKRIGRAVAFSNSIMLNHVSPYCPTPSYPVFKNWGEMEQKQDCPIDKNIKYKNNDTYIIEYTIGENNHFNGRNRVFEFDASPLDVAEFFVRLLPAEKTIAKDPQSGAALSGHFSVFDGRSAPSLGIAQNRFLIPRSPSEVLSSTDHPNDSDVRALECPSLPVAVGASRPLPATCRPWTRLGWTEILFGAQYRTFSDAQFDPKEGQPDESRHHFSFLRRRDMLRLHPEIEVEADRFALGKFAGANPPGNNFLAPENPAIVTGSRFAYMTQDPRVAKVGGDWSLFAGRIAAVKLTQNPSDLQVPPAFAQPLAGSLRYGIWPKEPTANVHENYDAARTVCAPDGVADIDKCEGYLAPKGLDVLSLPNLSWLPLVHQFQGPVLQQSYKLGLASIDDRSATSVCGAERPNRIASCWKGYDDTIFFERGISNTPSYHSSVYSVSALVGYERPPIAQFLFDFESYRRVACIDPQSPSNVPVLAGICQTEGEGQQTAENVPNRPTATSRAIEVFAPVQTSRSRSVSMNRGGNWSGMSGNDHQIDTDLTTTRQFVDVNGDGFPDVISNGSVELSSPVGIPRREWWAHFRATNELTSLGAGENAAGYRQNATTTSLGIGFGLSPDTAIKNQPRATRTRSSGSSDAAVEPSFDLSLENGHDKSFVELRDMNGDGLLDRIEGQKDISQGVKLSFNSGNALGSGWMQPLRVHDTGVEAYKFKTSHGAGFGVRLGYSNGSGSFVAGVGLSHRDSGSQAALMDFTGDGRPDIVLPHEDGFWVYPNLGNGFGPRRFHRLSDWKQLRQAGNESGTELSETTLVDAGAAYTYGFNTIFFKVVFNPHVKWSQGQTRELLSIRDINGDGVPDVVTVRGNFLPGPFENPLLAPSSLETKVHYNPEGKYHLLTEITNPSGSRIKMSHSLIGNSGPEHGRPVWALTGVARYDGLGTLSQSSGLPIRGHDYELTTYAYEKGYYNRAERQFYGFASRTARHYGCQSVAQGEQKCEFAPNMLDGLANRDEAVIFEAGFRKLQVVHQVFANRDYFTQGLELDRTVAGAISAPISSDKQAPELRLLSRETSRYSIDDLSTLAGDVTGKCNLPDRTPMVASWSVGTFAFGRSNLGPKWDGSTAFTRERSVLGVGGICNGLNGCGEVLRKNACDAGYEREQRAFWAQQSGSVRQRLVKLETFGGETPVVEPKLEFAPAVERLRSAIAYDRDQWGQVVGLNSIGEARSDWSPVADASTHSKVTYAQRQGLNVLPLPSLQPVGYPMLGLAQDVQVFGGPWSDLGSASPLRVREAVYSDNSGKPDDGSLRPAQTTDICTYPGGEGFLFKPGMCAAFKQNTRDALSDGYSTPQDALRAAYAKTDGLPQGVASFDAIMHHQMREYDGFGNLLHAISPMSRSNEWLERRFDYSADPFKRTATELSLTRCVNDSPGAGADSPDITRMPPDKRPRCTLGLSVLPDAVQRRAITHRSSSRIDHHFGGVAETRDINENSILVDVDRWGRLSLIARSWGNAPRENRTLVNRLQRAVAKDHENAFQPADVPIAEAEKWRLLAVVDYERMAAGLLRSNIRRFESSDAYSGLLGRDQTTRETAMFADGHGRLILNLRETDVCLGVGSDFIADGKNKSQVADLRDRCTGIATIAATPGVKADSLGRTLETFESYAWAGSTYRENSRRRLITLTPPTGPPVGPTLAVSSTTYDGAGRPLRVQSRLSDTDAVTVKGAAQYDYRIVPETGDRPARFQALNLSPRCTASAVWSDARGLRRTVFEDQQRFYTSIPMPPLGATPIGQTYSRDYARTQGFCTNISAMAGQWSVDAEASSTSNGSQPARVSYIYDPLQQLTSVDSPLDGANRARTAVRFDLLGRTREMQEPNSGCTVYEYDGLNSLISETGFRHEGDPDTPCGTASKVRNQKSYSYAAGRMVRMAYRSLEEQGSPPDERDAVRIFHDRAPSAIIFGTLSEALRFVPNDQANRRFIDTAGRSCDNCVGQATVVSDRTGARAFSFNGLGLTKREVRSVVGPLRDVKQSEGQSETYLPEVAFYEMERAHTAFGDPVQERFAEAVPMNPANACIKGGVNTCLARFTIGRRYAPDGAVAQLLFNGKPIIQAAQDALARPAIRWTASGIATGYSYDPLDLRLNRMTTLTAAAIADRHRPVQAIGYQYDGGGNILDFSNQAMILDSSSQRTPDAYESAFAFQYDPVNRLIGFNAEARRGQGGPDDAMRSSGSYAYDMGHRFRQRSLTIGGGAPGSNFTRRWQYDYGVDPRKAPLHAPSTIDFGAGASDNPPLRHTKIVYDDLGRMKSMHTPDPAAGADVPPSLLSNRAMTWDAEGRLIRVRGVKDGGVPGNERAMREEYIYDSGGNRTLKINRPVGQKPGETEEREHEAATLYLTPFYSRPYDRRGTVQIAQGSLPAVSLMAPADPSENPVATYLFSDLPVGSMTAAVTVTGEATDPNAVKIARREYSPYGLELTSDSLAQTGREGAAPLSVFHGKELDRVTNFSSFGARYFSRDAGIWLNPDPAYRSFLGGEPVGGVYAPRTASQFAFAGQNPIKASDPTGRVFDVVLDVGFIIYDLYALGRDEIQTGGVNRAENLAALAADVGSAIVPFATGGGVAVRGGIKVTEHAVSTAKSLDKIKDGAALPTTEALELATEFLGKNYDQIAPGVYKSADGKRVVRMTDHDLGRLKNGSPNPSGKPHLNFETGKTVNDNGRSSFKTDRKGGNKHIYLPEEK